MADGESRPQAMATCLRQQPVPTTPQPGGGLDPADPDEPEEREDREETSASDGDDGGGTSIGLLPGPGDLLVMGGSCQRTWDHAVPKVSSAAPRMSVQFRHAYVR